MAAPHGEYFIGDALTKKAVHHESFAQLWATKWKFPCSIGVYPFMFGAMKDFQPIFDELIEKNFKEPYDWDAYAEVFHPHAEKLVNAASQAESAGETEKAAELYLRASAVYRISRFPIMRTPKQKYAWGKGKEACLKGLHIRNPATVEVQVPHTHALADEGKTIPIYYSLPAGASATAPVSLVTIFTGLDGYRTELAVWIPGWNAIGVGVAIAEIPGTGDCPAAPNDPSSPDRLYSSLIAWLSAQPEVDAARLVLWAFSTGGYYAIRVAHTHPGVFKGVVALGGGCHHMFDPAWLDAVNGLEYPFDLAGALAHKFGYANDEAGLALFKSEASAKFSLLHGGILDKIEGTGSTRLLLVNGTEDEIFPIDDYYLCLQHGAPKEARFVKGKKHMGEPESFRIIVKWIYDLLGIESDPGKQLSTLPFQPKY